MTMAPPSLSSTLTGTGRSLLSAGARLRAIRSNPPPALVLTTMVIGWFGQVSANARRVTKRPAAATPTSFSNDRRAIGCAPRAASFLVVLVIGIPSTGLHCTFLRRVAGRHRAASPPSHDRPAEQGKQ